MRECTSTFAGWQIARFLRGTEKFFRTGTSEYVPCHVPSLMVFVVRRADKFSGQNLKSGLEGSEDLFGKFHFSSFDFMSGSLYPNF